MLLPKTRNEVLLNRVRIWLPPLFVLVGLALGRPPWDWWGLPLVFLGETLRTWAAGNLIKDEYLTVGGPYAYVRNPLYLGSLMSGVGFLIVVGDWRLAAAFLVLSLAIYLPTVKHEQDYLRRRYGEAFDAYMRAVPSIIPRPTPARLEVDGVRHSRFEWGWVLRNKEFKTWVGIGVLFVLLAVRSYL